LKRPCPDCKQIDVRKIPELSDRESKPRRYLIGSPEAWREEASPVGPGFLASPDFPALRDCSD
jgi:hypothetical protein